MNQYSLYLLYGLLGICFVLALASHKRRLPLPPSPVSRHWLFGHVDFFNKQRKHVLMGTEYRELYGDVVSVSTGFKTDIYLNSVGAAVELLEKRAAVTADRPRNVMVNEIMGWAEGPGLHPHNERHKKMRRIMASVLHPASARSYAPQQLDTTLNLLRAIAVTPDNYAKLTANSIGAFLLRLTYGYVVTENDPLVQLVHSAMMMFGVGMLQHWTVNALPFLKYVPPWFPGAGFQKLGEKGRALRVRYVNEPFEAVLEQIRRGLPVRSSYTSQLIEAKGGVAASQEDMDLIKLTAAAMYSAGLSTTLDLVKYFFFLISLYPEVARQAQEEIDTIVGRDRIPNFGDRERLPLVEAVVLEVMRMSASAPIGLPHCATEEIDFRGYRIPKGATIYANIWAILRDPAHYPQPHKFTPSRFLKSSPDPDPRKVLFGFGRRVCPGLHVANNSAWIICAGLLAVFDIRAGEALLKRVKEVGGREGLGLVTLTEPAGAGPLPFDCLITPRDELAAALLEDTSD